MARPRKLLSVLLTLASLVVWNRIFNEVFFYNVRAGDGGSGLSARLQSHHLDNDSIYKRKLLRAKTSEIDLSGPSPRFSFEPYGFLPAPVSGARPIRPFFFTALRAPPARL